MDGEMRDRVRPDELLAVMKARRSIRRFVDRPVPMDVLRRAVEAASWAPSGTNQQEVRFLLTDDPRDVEIIRLCKPHLEGPKAAVLVAVDLSASYYQRYLQDPHKHHLVFMDVGAAVQNLLLYLHQAGLGACWLNVSRHWNVGVDRLFHRFRLPENWVLACAVLVGYPGEEVDPDTARHGGRKLQREPVDHYLFQCPDRVVLLGFHPPDFHNLGSLALSHGMRIAIDRCYPGAEKAVLNYWPHFPSCGARTARLFPLLDQIPAGADPLALLEARVRRACRLRGVRPDEPTARDTTLLGRVLRRLLPRHLHVREMLCIEPGVQPPAGCSRDAQDWLQPEGQEACRANRSAAGEEVDVPKQESPPRLRQALTALSAAVRRYLPWLHTELSFRTVGRGYARRLGVLGWGDIVLFDGDGAIAEPYKQRLPQLLAEVLIAKELGAELYAVNQTVDLGDPVARTLVAGVYNRLDGVVVREARSRDALVEMGVAAELILVASDAAALVDSGPGDAEQAENIMREAGIEPGAIGLVIRGDDRPNVSAARQLVTELADRFQTQIAFVSSAFADDVSFAQKVAAGAPLTVAPPVRSYGPYIELLRKLSVLVTARYHPVYFAIRAGCPVVPLGGNTAKTKGLFETIDYPVEVLERTDVAGIVEAVSYVREHREACIDVLAEAGRKLRERALLNADAPREFGRAR